MTPAQKGEIAQLKVQLRAHQKGIVTSRPTVDCRYDLVLDVGGKLLRAQIKYAASEGSTAEGSVVVGLRKWPGRKWDEYKVYTAKETDLILVYIPAVDKVACLTPDIFDGKSTVTVRFAPAKNAQMKGTWLLQDLLW